MRKVLITAVIVSLVGLGSAEADDSHDLISGGQYVKQITPLPTDKRERAVAIKASGAYCDAVEEASGNIDFECLLFFSRMAELISLEKDSKK